MATRKTVTDEYIIRPKVDDQASGGIDKVTSRLAGMEQSAAKAAAAAAALGQTANETGEKFSRAAQQFDNYAKKYDDVTRASLALKNAQNELQRAQESGQRALALGTTTQAAYDATTAGLAEKINRLAEALGVARANAEANAEAQARWNGQITGGSAVVKEFASGVADAAQAMKTSQIEFAAWMAKGEQFPETFAKVNAGLKAYASALVSLRGEFDPLYEAQQNYQQGLGRLDDAIAKTGISDARAAEARGELAASYQKEIDSITGVTAAQESLNAVTKASFAALEAYGSEMDQLQAKYDTRFKVSKTYEATVVELDQLLQAGRISQQLYNAEMVKAGEVMANAGAPVDAATNNTKAMTAAANNAAFAQRQAGVQFVQFTTSIASGAPILISAIQQGHQLVDVAVATGTGFGTLKDAAVNALTAIAGFAATHPVVIAITAITVAMAALSYEAESTLRVEETLRAELSATRDDYASLATAVTSSAKMIASATDLTRTQAATVAQAFAALPQVAGTSLTELGIMVANLARAMGTDLPAATKLGTEAFTEPAKAALAMASAEKPLRSMDAATLDLVQHLQQMGDRAGATKVVLAAMNQTAADSGNQQTPLRKALEDLSVAFTKVGGDGKSFAQSLGEGINNAAALAITAIAGVISALEAARQAARADYRPNIPASSGNALLAPDATGRGVLTNPDSHAMGMMQVIPDKDASGNFTTTRYGYDLTTTTGNVLAGLTDLKKKLDQANGDVDTALKNYGGFRTKDPAAYIASVKSKNINDLSPDKAALIEGEGQNLGVPPAVIRIGQQLALQESQGQQYGKAAPASSAATSSLAASGGFYGPPAPTQAVLTANAETNRQSILGVADEQSVNSEAKAIADLNLKLKELQAARQKIADSGSISTDDTARVGAYDAAIAKTKIDIENATDPTRAATLALMDQAKSAGIVGEADQRLADVQLRIARQREEHPNFPESEAAKAAEIAATIADLAAGTTKLLGQNDLLATQNDQVASAWDKGTAAATKAQIRIEAYNDALKTTSKTNPDFLNVVDRIAASLTKVANSAGSDAMNKLAAQTNEQAEATMRVANAWDGSADSLTHLQNIETARADALANKLIPGTAAYAEAVNKVTSALDNSARASKVMQQEQASVTAVAGAFSQAFNTVGNAITQAFVSGQGAAVNWGNVMKSVITQVIQKIAELAVLNPILNSLFGQNNGTLGTALQVFANNGASVSAGGGGGGGSSSSSGGGAMSLISGAGSLSSLSGSLGGPTIGSALGLTGPGGVLTNASTFLFGSTAQLPSIAGASAAQVASATAPSGLMSEAAVAGQLGTGQAAAAGSTGLLGMQVGTTTLGGAMTGVGLGFTLGNLSGSLVQNALGKTGPAPMIGAAAGALAGAIVGSAFPVVGTFLGAIIGGALGGTGGGFIGPHVQSSYSGAYLGNDGSGKFIKGAMAFQRDPNAGAEDAAMATAVSGLNTLMEKTGAKITAQNAMIQFGTGGPDPTKYSGFDTPNITGKTAFSQFGFGSDTDPILNDKLKGKVFQTTDDFQKYLIGYANTQTILKAYLDNTDKLMKSLGVTTGSLNDAIDQMNAAYADDKKAADAMLATEFLSEKQTADLTAAEAKLLKVRDDGIAAAKALAQAQVDAADAGLQSRILNATAQMSGSAADAMTAALYVFDAKAVAERASFSQSLVALYGDVYKTTKGYADQMALLEKTLGIERLTITTQANDAIIAKEKAATDQAAQAATSLVTSLRSWITGLAQGSTSPLSPAAKLSLAQEDFTSTNNKAQGGDATSMGNLQTSGNTLLAAAQAYYGSSSGYVTVFNQVINAVKGIAAKSPDSLTASFLAAQVQAQTTTLSAELQKLRTTVGVLQAAMVAATDGSATLIGQNVGTQIQLADQVNLVLAHQDQIALQGAIATVSAQINTQTATLVAWGQAWFGWLVNTVNLASTTAVASAGGISGQIAAQWSYWGAALLAKLNSGPTIVYTTGGYEPATGGNGGPDGPGGSGYAAGGWIGNGEWNRDSVRAAYAGGGNVMLAGGEFVVSAPAAARYADVLPGINASTYRSGSSNDNASIVAELRALRVQAGTSQIAELRSQTSTLVDAIAALQAELKALRADVSRNSAKPGRLAA